MGQPHQGSYATQFVDRRDSGCQVDVEQGAEVLVAHSPNQLANFVAFCKARRRRIYFRGQTRLYPTLQPSLFRAQGDLHARWRAYARFVRELPTSVTGTRYRRKNFGAVLQHYGFTTAWLDVVDDIHAAVWFALHRFSSEEGRHFYRRSDSAHAWVVLLSVPRSVRRQDLRESQSSRNARCHAQQGWSLAMQHDSDHRSNAAQDFSGFVIARVRIPNEPKWHLTGFMASQEFLFPSAELDSTYKHLQSADVGNLVARIEIEEGIPPRTLGRTAIYGADQGNSAL